MIVAFDLDGTLVDSAADLARSANALVAGLGGRPLDPVEIADMVGDGAGELVRRALAASGVSADLRQALARFLEIYDRHLLDSTDVYDGVREMLPLVARRARLAVLTNKPRAHSERLLAALRIRDFFDTVIGGDGPLGRKPAPEGMRSLTVQAGAGALLVGDSPIDASTARAAGCSFAWARYGFGARRFGTAVPETPYVLDSPRDLVAVVDRLTGVTSGH